MHTTSVSTPSTHTSPTIRKGAAVPPRGKDARFFIPATRMALGFVYLWALVDKMFGLGVSTPAEDSVLSGASPSVGYLSSTEGAFSEVFHTIAGNPLVDFLFLFGLGAVGIALIAGVCLRLAALGGTLLMSGIYLSALPLANNPLVDEHLIYVLLGWLLASINAGLYFGLGKKWQALPIVRENRWLH